MTEWRPNLDTKRAVKELLDEILTQFLYLLGIDEIISSCEVIDMDPYATGTLPRYIRVRIHQYYQDVTFRGGFSIAVGDYVNVIHLREGDRYEVLTVGGAAGTTTFIIESLADYARGHIIRGGATGWESYPAYYLGHILVGDGTDINSVDLYCDGDLYPTGCFKVLALQGRPVRNHPPVDGEVLTWDAVNGWWEPLPAYGSTYGEETLRAKDLFPSTTGGCAALAKTEYGVNNVGYESLDFDQSAIEYAEALWWPPEDWDGGTITYEVIWTADGLYAYLGDDVQWNLQGRAYANGDAIDQAWGASVEVSDPFQTAGAMHRSAESAAVTLAGGPVAGEPVLLRVWRDAVNDALLADAKLLAVKLHYAKA